jgi:transcriptional regulator with XRE-family HTH domain
METIDQRGGIMATKRIIDLSITTLTEKGQEVFDHFNEQERKARIRKGLSQRELSSKIGRSKTFVSKMEKNEVLPSVTDLLAMTIVLEEPFKYFFPSFAYYKTTEDEPDGEELEFLKALRKIKSKQAKRIAFNTVEQLAEIK